MSQPLHSIRQLSLDRDTFLDLYVRVNDLTAVVNQIRIYDIQATGGIRHQRQISGGVPVTTEVISLNIASTGGFGQGLGLVSVAGGGAFEGGAIGVRLDVNSLQATSQFVGVSGATVHVEDFDWIVVGASGSRGDGNYRARKVFAKDMLPYNINGEHRFTGNVYFDGDEVVINSSQLHIDDNLLFIASAGSSDNPSGSGLSNDETLAGGSGSGIVIKGASGDKFIAYQKSDGTTAYYSFRVSENLQVDKAMVSPTGQFKFVGVSGAAPSISLRTKGQDQSALPVGWKIYQSATGDSVGTLKVIREGVTQFNTLELYTNSEVKIGSIYEGSSGANGTFKTRASKFSVPGTNSTGVIHYGWQNRDVEEFAATADQGRFAESLSAYSSGTVLTFDDNGNYIRASWDADPATGYKKAEVVGILEKFSSDYVLQVPLTGGSSYTTSGLLLNEPVSISSGAGTIYGYIYETLPPSGLSGVKVFVDEFPAGITPGSLTAGSAFFTLGATLYGTYDDDAFGISGSMGITVSEKQYATIVRQGVFSIPQTGSGATGYDDIDGLTAGYLFYLAANGGITYASGNLFDPVEFYEAGANVSKPLFLYLGTVEGERAGLLQAYQGLGLTYSVTSSENQPVYYETRTGELSDFGVLGEGGIANKILNSGFDIWSRLDLMGATYSGWEGSTYSGITIGSTTRAEYPFGATYTGLDSGSAIVSSYITDGYFFDTVNHGGGNFFVSRETTEGIDFSGMVSQPNHQLRIMRVSASGSQKPRLYAIVPDVKTLSSHDLNFSFWAKTDATSIGFTAGVAFVWNDGATYAVVEGDHAFGSDGTTSGLNFYKDTLDGTYQRYQFAFTSQSLQYPGASGDRASFVAPFIEFDTLGTDESVFLTALQLSKGMSPKPYQKRSYAEEKTECDRFFQNVVIGHGGYYPVSTGESGPELFASVNLSIPFAESPSVVTAVDVINRGVDGASANGDPQHIRKNYISVFRTPSSSSGTYHRYFETAYALDASGFSGAVQSVLMGLT